MGLARAAGLALVCAGPLGQKCDALRAGGEEFGGDDRMGPRFFVFHPFALT